MQMFEYKCKNCGANLQLDLDHLQGYCQHCGSAVMIESATLSKLMMEREKTKQIKMQHAHEERMFDKRIEAERKAKRAEGIKSFLHSDIAKILLIPLFVIICFSPMIIFCIIDSIQSAFITYELPFSDEEIMGKKLEVVKETFRDAGFRNITIDSTTNSYGVLAEGQVAEVTVNGKNAYKKGDKYKKNDKVKIVILLYSPDGKFSFPYSKDTAIGQEYRDVKSNLESLGFNNIQTVEKSSVASFLSLGPTDAITKMLVNGNEEFNIGDRYPLDVSILLEYYD